MEKVDFFAKSVAIQTKYKKRLLKKTKFNHASKELETLADDLKALTIFDYSALNYLLKARYDNSDSNFSQEITSLSESGRLFFEECLESNYFNHDELISAGINSFSHALRLGENNTLLCSADLCARCINMLWDMGCHKDSYLYAFKLISYTSAIPSLLITSLFKLNHIFIISGEYMSSYKLNQIIYTHLSSAAKQEYKMLRNNILITIILLELLLNIETKTKINANNMDLNLYLTINNLKVAYEENDLLSFKICAQQIEPFLTQNHLSIVQRISQMIENGIVLN